MIKRILSRALPLLAAFAGLAGADDIDQPRHTRVSNLAITTETPVDLWMGIWVDDPSGTTKRAFRSLTLQSMIDAGWFSFEISDGTPPDFLVAGGDTLDFASATTALLWTAAAGPQISLDLDLGLQLSSTDNLSTLLLADNGNRLQPTPGNSLAMEMRGGLVDMATIAANTVTFDTNFEASNGDPLIAPSDPTTSGIHVDLLDGDFWYWNPNPGAWIRIEVLPSSEINFWGYESETLSPELPTNGRFSAARFAGPLDSGITNYDWAVDINSDERSAWNGAGILYVPGDCVIHNNVLYSCYVQHTSGAGNEPGGAGGWAAVWDPLISSTPNEQVLVRLPDQWTTLFVFLTVTDVNGETSSSQYTLMSNALKTGVLTVAPTGNDAAALDAYQTLYAGGRRWSQSAVFRTLEAAAGAGVEGELVEVGPGTYPGENNVGLVDAGASDFLIHGPATIIGNGTDPVFYIDEELEDFSIVGDGNVVIDGNYNGGANNGGYCLRTVWAYGRVENIIFVDGENSTPSTFGAERRMKSVLLGRSLQNPVPGLPGQMSFRNCKFGRTVWISGMPDTIFQQCEFDGGMLFSVNFDDNQIDDIPEDYTMKTQLVDCEVSGEYDTETTTQGGMFNWRGVANDSSGADNNPQFSDLYLWNTRVRGAGEDESDDNYVVFFVKFYCNNPRVHARNATSFHVRRVYATNTLTMDTQPLDLDTVTVNDQTYTFRNPFVDAAGNINASSLPNAQAGLVGAITGGAGAGTLYGTATAQPTDVTCEAAFDANDELEVSALTTGPGPDAYPVAISAPNTWQDAFLGTINTTAFGADSQSWFARFGNGTYNQMRFVRGLNHQVNWDPEPFPAGFVELSSGSFHIDDFFDR